MDRPTYKQPHSDSLLDEPLDPVVTTDKASKSETEEAFENDFKKLSINTTQRSVGDSGIGSIEPDEEVRANCAPGARASSAIVPVAVLPPFPNAKARPSRQQEMKTKQCEVPQANPCTASLPCHAEETISALFASKQQDQLMHKLDGKTTGEADKAGHSSSLPVLTQEQHVMFDQDEDGDNQLMIAAEQANERATQYIIKKAPHRIYLDMQNKSYQTALHIAVSNSLHLTAAVLLEAGASLNFFDYEGNTPLNIAAFQGDYRMLFILLQYATKCGRRESFDTIKTLLDTRNYEGFTCFHLVVWSGNAEAIHYLARCKINVNAKDGKSGRTALHHAVEGGNTQLVKYLLEVIRVAVNEETFSNDTALSLAKGRNLAGIAQLLAQHGGVESDRSYSSDEDSENDSPMDECV